MNPFKTIYHQLYLFQLENYELARFWQGVFKTPFIRRKIRKKIVWTPKAVSIAALALLLDIAIAVWLSWSAFENNAAFAAGFLALFYIFSAGHFIFLSAAAVLLLPADFFLKRRIVSQAKSKLGSRKDLKIIGITGSYGKTTMKNILSAVLSERYKVLTTPESVNTPVGIGRLILGELAPDTEALIVEMGAYRRGDIKQLCDLARPDIAILTGINEQHIERFGSLENTVKAKFEIAEHAKPDAVVFLNGDDKNIRKNYQNFLSGRKHAFYGFSAAEETGWEIRDYQFYQNGSGQSFSITPVISPAVKVPLLGKYAPAMIMGAAMAAKALQMAPGEIRRGIFAVRNTSHRLEPQFLPDGVILIDDSYNGNPDGAMAAMEALKNFRERRKIYVTPGLVEMGDKSMEIHRHLGKNLANAADLVVLIKNSATPHIFEGLREAGYNMERVMWFDDIQAFFRDMRKVVKAGDVVLLQNDWPESYR